MLLTQELWKSYGSRPAVTGVSFSAAPGEIVGLLGPNGAGKSTTVAMICGLTQPDRGRVTIGGEIIASDASRVKCRVGLVPQDIALYEDLAAIRNLELFGALYGISGALLRERCAQALELVGLADRARDKPQTFSGGMKRRLNIACALIHDPDLLLLDEPTVGVDPQSRNAIFENLATLKARGKSIVYTTHYMEEAEKLCDRIVIIDRGKVVASGSLEELYQRLPAAESLNVDIDGDGHAVVDTEALMREVGVKSAIQAHGKLTLGIDDLAQAAPVLSWLGNHGHAIRRVSSGHVTLENVFLAVTGRQLRD